MSDCELNGHDWKDEGFVLAQEKELRINEFTYLNQLIAGPPVMTCSHCGLVSLIPKEKSTVATYRP